VEITFSATNPGSSFNFTVYTSENGTSTNSPTVAVSSAPPTLSAASSSGGVNTTWTIGSLGATNATGGTWGTFSASATTLELVASNPNAHWYNGTAGYSVMVTPSSGTATADAVTGVNFTTANGGTGTPSSTVFLTLTNAIAQGSTASVVALVTNPTTGTSYVTVTPGTVSGATFTGVASAENSSQASPLSFGSSVTAVTAAVSPLVAAASANYTISFKATTCVGTSSCTTGAGDIFISETSGPTSFLNVNGISGGILVSDSTSSWHYVVPVGGAALANSNEQIGVPLGGNTIAAGDSVTVTLVDVTNPGTGTYSDLDVWTLGDPVAAAAPAYSIGASGTSVPQVTVVPSTVGSVATYTITGLYATAAFTGGNNATPIELTAPAGTVFPNSGGDYLLSDATTTSGSGTFTLLHYNGATDVVLVPPNNITSGDVLSITIDDVINPSTSSSADSMMLTGNVSGQSGVAPFPHANVTYPNGSIVDFNKTFYVFAGGHPFGIASPTILSKVEAVDKAAVQAPAAGALLPTVAPRVGTLITTNVVNSNPTIYVVGANGDLYGFASSKTYLSYGYDPATAVTVPSLGGLTVSSTTADAAGASVANALATSSDGAIVDSSKTYYVFDGGRAFGIPTAAALTAVEKPDTATPLTGSIGAAQTGAAFANGALVTVNGEVYVGYQNALFGFKSGSQLDADGYAGTYSITSWNYGGLSVVSTYSGS